MKFMRITLLYVAAFLVVAHALVPHEHMEKNQQHVHEQAHEEADSFLDFLALGFHHQQHEGQLEYFTQGESTEITSYKKLIPEFYSLVYSSPRIVVIQFEPDNIKAPTFSENSTSDYSSAYSRRGPPLLLS
jgi:hypothetical protein